MTPITAMAQTAIERLEVLITEARRLPDNHPGKLEVIGRFEKVREFWQARLNRA